MVWFFIVLDMIVYGWAGWSFSKWLHERKLIDPTAKVPKPALYNVVRYKAERLLEIMKLEHEAGTVDLGAVNLAHLHISEVAWVVPEQNQKPYWRFTIEEASPDCNLPKLFHERFHMPEAYEINCEW